MSWPPVSNRRAVRRHSRSSPPSRDRRNCCFWPTRPSAATRGLVRSWSPWRSLTPTAWSPMPPARPSTGYTTTDLVASPDRFGKGQDAVGIVDVEVLDHPAVHGDHSAPSGLGVLERRDDLAGLLDLL